MNRAASTPSAAFVHARHGSPAPPPNGGWRSGAFTGNVNGPEASLGGCGGDAAKKSRKKMALPHENNQFIAIY
jgi:hypothetical protein